MAAAVRYLARAARTTVEVTRHLEQLGVGPELVELTLGTLRDRGYVDDVALAERRAEELLLRRGSWSSRRSPTN